MIGLNVTIPYKESVLQYLDEISDDANTIGAVNCIKILVGKLIGYNTDAFGFEESLANFVDKKIDMAFVLGTGGSSKAIQFVLHKMNIPFQLVSSKNKERAIAYSEIESHLGATNLYINTTPLGMFPETGNCPDIPYNKLTERDFLFDLIYNPAETLFLKKGKQQGCKTENGLEMLKLQAEKSWEIWNRE